jgi:hypothetical protein
MESEAYLLFSKQHKCMTQSNSNWNFTPMNSHVNSRKQNSVNIAKKNCTKVYMSFCDQNYMLMPLHSGGINLYSSEHITGFHSGECLDRGLLSYIHACKHTLKIIMGGGG